MRRSPYVMTYFHPRDFDPEQPLVPGINGVRRFKSFADLAKAKKDAKAVLRENLGTVRTQVHMTEDERLDWKAAVDLLRAAGIRSTLESVARHYADLAGIVKGYQSLIKKQTDQFQKLMEGLGNSLRKDTSGQGNEETG